MKSKLTFLAVATMSAVLLSACGAETAINNSPQTGNQNPSQVQGQTQDQTGQAGPSGAPDRNGRPRMDLTAAAAKLNVTEAALQEALGIGESGTVAVVTGRPSGGPQRMDLAAAAAKLNVTEAALQEALGIGGSGGHWGRPQNGGQPTNNSQ